MDWCRQFTSKPLKAWVFAAAALILIPLQGAAQAGKAAIAACSPCHPVITKNYSLSAMARTSGEVDEIVRPGSLEDESTKATYSVESRADGAWELTIQRAETGLDAKRHLQWFVGAGRVGRSFLFATGNGFIYQSPVSFYTETGAWRPSPGYGRKTSVDLTRAVEPSCLNCHASGVQHVAGTQNGYAPEPFAAGGITCERCHGAAGKHIAAMRANPKGGRTHIINPSKLDAERRDSVCAQCHLTGAARVSRNIAGRKRFEPGDRLSDYLAVFVWSEAKSSGLAVTSHYEKLSYSKCKQGSGAERFWCGSCHDPHNVKKVDIRQVCLSCHVQNPCSLDIAARKQAGDSCQGCHMPKAGVADVEHGVYTDHSIPRTAPERTIMQAAGDLIPFWPGVATERDTALAHAAVALTEARVRPKAFSLLRSAVSAMKEPDTPIMAQLAQFLDRMNQPAQALPLLERVAATDGVTSASLINLGTLYAMQDRLPEAMAAWRRALAMNPALTQARLNLAVAQLKTGDRAGGLSSLDLALLYDPDSPDARRLHREFR
jgi:Tfp pilus assembly protein PilF